MKKQSPQLVIYGRTYEEAFDVIWRRQLRQCEVACPLIGIWFDDESDLVLFVLNFRNEVQFEDSLVIVPPTVCNAVLDFINYYSMKDRVRRVDLLGVWFWSSDDQTTFDEEFGLPARLESCTGIG